MIFSNPSRDLQAVAFKPFKIAWLFPGANLEDYLEKNPSHRLRRFQMNNYLNSLEIIRSEYIRSSTYLQESPDHFYENHLRDFDFIVMFSVDPWDRELCEIMAHHGKKIIFDHCENIFGLGGEDDIMQYSSAITCCSRALARNTEYYIKSQAPNRLGGFGHPDKPLFVIRDPIDSSALYSKQSTVKIPNRVLVMGMGANVKYVLPFLEEVCSKTGNEIFILSEKDFDFSPHISEVWSLNKWVNSASSCSVALCYHDKEHFPAKGNVKVTMPMSIGLPVVACPVESYDEAIIDGYNGYIAETEQEWINNLNALKNEDLRRIFGLRAQHHARTNYGMDKIGLDYLTMIGYLQQEEK